MAAAQLAAAQPTAGTPAAGMTAAGTLATDTRRPAPPAARGRPGQVRFPRVAARTPRGELASVGPAREFARSILQRWGATGHSDDIALVVSELLTNALRHTRPLPGGWPVRVGLLQSRPGSGVLCAVADPSPAPPVLPVPGDLAECGRGLQVVQQLSDTWGYTTPDHRGKVVWAMFAPDEVPALPQRIPGQVRPRFGHRTVHVTDLVLLTRVLRGLESL
jgi:anti-sigma regulatory factor (Ser/Thr protein kinase)